MQANVWPVYAANKERQTMKKRLLLAAVLGIALSACTPLPPAKLIAPSLKFSRVELIDVGLNRMKFAIVVDALNSNNTDIPLNNLVFNLNLLGVALGHGGTKEASVVLPQGKSVQIPLEFTASTAQVLQLLRSANWRSLDTLAYHISGSAQWGNFPVTIPFDRKGDLQAAQKWLDILRTFR
jgi:LEA14-like dessication related protein